VLQYVEGFEDGSIVCIALNTHLPININFKNYLSQFGLSAIMEYTGGDVYTCSFKKGTKENSESYNTDKIVRVHKVFDDPKCRYFMADIKFSGDEISEKKYVFLMSDFKNVEDVSSTITKTNITDLSNPSNEAQMIIIYHKEFETISKEYAEFRRRQGYSIFEVDVEDIYKEFNYGKKNPQAIKDFLFTAFHN